VNSVIPPWLQIAGVVGGLVGTGLGLVNLYLRIREKRPRLSVMAEQESMQEDGETKYRLVVVVRNRASIPVLVDSLYFEAPRPRQGMSEIRVRETYGGREIPFWLEPGDRERFQVMTEFMFHRMVRKGFEGRVWVTATVVDGGGNRYRSNPLDVDLSDLPRPLPDEQPT